MDKIFKQGRAIKKIFCFFIILKNYYLMFQNIYYKYFVWTVTKFKEPYVRKQHYLSWHGVTKKNVGWTLHIYNKNKYSLKFLILIFSNLTCNNK